MASKSAQEPHFKWINRQLYKDEQLQKSVDKLTHNLAAQDQVLTVLESFDKVIKKSQLGLIYFNEQNKLIKVYSVGINATKGRLNSHGISFLKWFSDSKQKYSHKINLRRYFNGQGTRFKYFIFEQQASYSYGVSFDKYFNQRIDNHFCTTKDRLAIRLHKKYNKNYIDDLTFEFGRQSRENYLSFFGKDKKDAIFKLSQDQKNRIRQSNLWFLKCKYQYSIFKALVKLGYDYGNTSLFSEINLSLKKQIDINKNIAINIKIQAGQLFGKNILKNDYLFRNKKDWSQRTTNYYNQKVQVLFKNYPYLSFLGIQPYIYCLTSHYISSLKDDKRIVSNEFDYGLGLSLREDSQIDMSLLKMSAQRQDGIFGSIKFSF